MISFSGISRNPSLDDEEENDSLAAATVLYQKSFYLKTLLVSFFLIELCSALVTCKIAKSRLDSTIVVNT